MVLMVRMAAFSTCRLGILIHRRQQIALFWGVVVEVPSTNNPGPRMTWWTGQMYHACTCSTILTAIPEKGVVRAHGNNARPG